MRRRTFTDLLLRGSLGLSIAPPAWAAATLPAPVADGSILTNAEAWMQFRQTLLADPASLRELRAAADDALKVKGITVMEKKTPPPSGDAHDYSSLGPYWWPDPAKPGGLPYIRKDGEVNPEYYHTDRIRLSALCEATSALILAAYGTGPGGATAAYAGHAAKLLRGWFLEAETRMNPNLNFGQAVPGRNTGRSTGIIDTASLAFLVDAVGRLPASAEWTAKHQDDLRSWFSRYLDWLLESKIGQGEGAAENNHGTWYDVQVSAFALFCGRPEVAHRQIEKSAFKRVKTQLQPDGRQPLEMERTLSLSYSSFNALGLVCLAQLARRVDLDLWGYEDAGRSVAGAVRFLIPYYRGEKKWEGKQIKEFRTPLAAFLLHLAAEGSGQDDLRRAAAAFPAKPWSRCSYYAAALRDDAEAGPEKGTKN